MKKLLALTVIVVLISCGKKKSETANASVEAEKKPAVTKVGEALATRYFEVTVNEVSLADEIDTGNRFSSKAASEGNKFLVINATFKNTDEESRTITSGSVWINYNGKDYEFDKAEPIMADGWGLIMKRINPLTSVTTNLVYEIPKEITGTAYFQPGRSNKDELIVLGNL